MPIASRVWKSPKTSSASRTSRLSQDEVGDLKALGVCNFKLANRQVPTQQHAKRMDDYIIDRLGLSTTMCRARVLSAEVRA